MFSERKKGNIDISNILFKTFYTKKHFYMFGFLVFKGKESNTIDKTKIKLLFGERLYPIKFISYKNINIPILKNILNFYGMRASLPKLATLPINNLIRVVYVEEDEIVYKKALRYKLLFKKPYNNKYIKKLKECSSSLYLRQNAKNGMVLTVRNTNKSDNLNEQIKINFAYFLSKFMKHDKTLMYEKESERYEESASIIFEKLVKRNYKNIYFIINKDNSNIKKIPDYCKNNIIYKNTLKHYIAFFTAKTFIGTEAPSHAIDLRIANKYAVRKIYSNDFKYVFLQHGVMMMVSLDSKGRSFFRKDGLMPKNAKVVVSSVKEAEHFVELGGYNMDDLYISGLPKFDKNKHYRNARKIVIMPTWRPWEFNSMRVSIEKTGYYKMVKEIIDNIPEKFRKKIVLLPHPLVAEYLKDSEYSKYMLKKFIYDEVLKDCNVLITDYSSVAFDAFYRGANVIFWWKDKDACMQEYEGKLMLNMDNVYGPVCYNGKELSKAVEATYRKKQSKENKEKYQDLVNFHDNNNSERLIEFMERDKIIEKENNLVVSNNIIEEHKSFKLTRIESHK